MAEFCECVNKYKCVISCTLNTVTHSTSEPAASLPGLQWVSERGQSQHQSGNLICPIQASGINAMCLSWQHQEEREEYMTEALNHRLSVLWMSLTVTPTTVGQDLASRQWRVLTIHYTCKHTQSQQDWLIYRWTVAYPNYIFHRIPV